MPFQIPIFQGFLENKTANSFFQTLFGAWTGSVLVVYRYFVIESWNMQSQTTYEFDFNTALVNKTKMGRVVSLSVMINNDLGSASYDCSLVDNGLSVGNVTFADTKVVLTRKSGGFFDSSDFSATDVTRGRVLLGYTA